MSSPLFIDAATVKRVLDPENCIAVIRQAMRDLSAAGVAQPLRQIVTIAPGKLFGVMPGTLAGNGGFGAKLVSVFPNPEQPDRQRHRGVVMLFDRDGQPLATVDAESVTEVRTAAASAVATDVLARPDAATLGLFGCGLQASAHLVAIACIRPIELVRVWGRNLAKADAFARRMTAETGIAVEALASPEAVAQADILCTLTSAQTPVLEGAWVRPGTHVNAVGSSYIGPREVDRALVVAARFVADSRAGALAQGAEFLEAKEAGAIGDDHVVAEIGDVLLERVPGRTNLDEITLYKSLGHIVQDLAAAQFVYDRLQGDRP